MGFFGLGKNPQKLYEKGLDAYAAEDYEKALSLLEQAARLDHVAAAFKCARMYELGRGTVKDESKALRWYEQAGEQNYIEAELKCAEMYTQGRGTAGNVEKALKWYRKVLSQYKENNRNHTDSEYTHVERSIFLLEEKRTEALKDGERLFQEAQAAGCDSEALRLYEAAAEREHSEAAYLCGRMYREGKGTAADPAKALRWLEASHEKEASFICAEMYKNGEGTTVDLRKAIRCLLWIADMDYPEAQLECGKLFYALGDEEQAYFWLAKAALQDQDLYIQEEASDFIETHMEERMGDLLGEL